MARPSENRLEGIHCENIIKEGKRKGQVCNKLLLAKNGLTIWDDRCESAHSLLDLLKKALDLKYLTPKNVLKCIPRLQQKTKEEKKKMTHKGIVEIREVRHQDHANELLEAGWELLEIKTEKVLYTRKEKYFPGPVQDERIEVIYILGRRSKKKKGEQK